MSKTYRTTEDRRIRRNARRLVRLLNKRLVDGDASNNAEENKLWRVARIVGQAGHRYGNKREHERYMKRAKRKGERRKAAKQARDEIADGTSVALLL